MLATLHGGIADGEELTVATYPDILRVTMLPPDGDFDALDDQEEDPGVLTNVYKRRTTGPDGVYDLVLHPMPEFCAGAEWALLLEELTATYFPGELPSDTENDALARIDAGDGVWCIDGDGDGVHDGGGV